MRRLLFLALPLLSCGNMGPPDTGGDPPDAPGAAPDRPGTRLKPIYERWTAVDGARVTLPTNRFRDTKLNVDCTFEIAEDGLKRCLPALPRSFKGGSSVSGYFLDAACTQNVVMYNNCVSSLKYAIEKVPGPTSCGPDLLKIHQVGSAVTPATLYLKSGPSCTAVADTDRTRMLGTSTFYRTTTVVDPTEFVKGDVEDVVAP
jgi:hypothetical protein